MVRLLMRTTVTLDADVQQLVTQAMRERGLSFKEAVNDAIRRGLVASDVSGRSVEMPTYDLGPPLVDVTKALRLAGELEDQELSARVARGS
jgi:hypothetical protein